MQNDFWKTLASISLYWTGLRSVVQSDSERFVLDANRSRVQGKHSRVTCPTERSLQLKKRSRLANFPFICDNIFGGG